MNTSVKIIMPECPLAVETKYVGFVVLFLFNFLVGDQAVAWVHTCLFK